MYKIITAFILFSFQIAQSTISSPDEDSYLEHKSLVVQKNNNEENMSHFEKNYLYNQKIIFNLPDELQVMILNYSLENKEEALNLIKNFRLVSKDWLKWISKLKGDSLLFSFKNIQIESFNSPFNRGNPYNVTLNNVKFNESLLLKDIKLLFNEGLECLVIKGPSITNSQIKNIVLALESCESLSKLVLLQCFNKEGDEGCLLFKEILGPQSNLVQINLDGNCITERGMSHLVKALEGNKKLKVLELSENELGLEGVKHVASLLAPNFGLNLIALDLSLNDLGPEGAVQIAQALTNNKSLQSLILYQNNIEFEGAEAIAEMLKFNRTLKIIDIDSNRIGVDGILLFLGVFNNNNKLKNLDIRSNYGNPASQGGYWIDTFYTETKEKLEKAFENYKNRIRF